MNQHEHWTDGRYSRVCCVLDVDGRKEGLFVTRNRFGGGTNSKSYRTNQCQVRPCQLSIVSRARSSNNMRMYDSIMMRDCHSCIIKFKKRQLWDRGFRQKSSLQAAWDTSIARGFCATSSKMFHPSWWERNLTAFTYTTPWIVAARVIKLQLMVVSAPFFFPHCV